MYLVSFQFFVCKLPSGCWRIHQLSTVTSQGTEFNLSVVHQLLPEEQPQEYSVVCSSSLVKGETLVLCATSASLVTGETLQ